LNQITSSNQNFWPTEDNPQIIFSDYLILKHQQAEKYNFYDRTQVQLVQDTKTVTPILSCVENIFQVFSFIFRKMLKSSQQPGRLKRYVLQVLQNLWSFLPQRTEENLIRSW
jgi:hypothetical protein